MRTRHEGSMPRPGQGPAESTVRRALTAAAEYTVARAGLAAVRALDRDVIGQAHHPRGAAGRVTAWEMALRPSNRQRNRWVAALLDVRPADRVLEIGCGPGVAVAVLARAGAGHVYGLDHSGVMLRQAARRHAAAIRAGRVTLGQASADRLSPSPPSPHWPSGPGRPSGWPSCVAGWPRAGGSPSRPSRAARAPPRPRPAT